ncbi:MAG: hypothetical protein ABIJ34_00670 [archaeon]
MKSTVHKFAVAIVLLILVFNAHAEDTDGDGLDDTWEIRYFGNRTLTGTSDPDWDTLYNIIEYKLGSNPMSNDSDSDFWSDTLEYLYGTNLTDATSYPTKSLVNITITNPKYGVSAAAPFDLILKTSNTSDCKYSTSKTDTYDSIDSASQKFSTTNGFNHQILNFPLSTSFDTAIYVFCKTKLGYANDAFPKEFLLSIDSSEPRILLAKANPEKVIEKLEVELIADTDDKTVCKFPILGTNLSDMKNLFIDSEIEDFTTHNVLKLTKYSSPKIEDNKKYTFVVACMNRAEMPAISQISFDVDLSVKNLITLKLPSGYLQDIKSELRVVTNKDSTCKYGEGFLYQFPQVSKKEHYIARENLSEGTYSIPILCVFGDASVLEDTISFVVDRSPPEMYNVSSILETCASDHLSVDYYSLDTDILNYTVKLLDYKNSVLYSANTNLNHIELFNLSLERSQKYYWEVSARDNAGNNGTIKKSLGTTILPEDTEVCMTNSPPKIEVQKTLTPFGVKVDLACKDDDIGGSCASTYYSIIDSSTNSSCKECGSCGYTRYLSTSNILIKEASTICYNITDNKKKSVEDSFVIKYQDCSKNESCCVDKQGYYCTDDCSLITDLDCILDNLDLDGDGILDLKEKDCGLDPKNKDDALQDFDNDTIKNKDECLTYKTDLNKKDTDGDEYDDNVEITQGTNPLDKNSFPVDLNKDSDDDGISDIKEKECGLDPNNQKDANLDNDDDGLSNYRECIKYGTKIDDPDTDGDDYADGLEIEKETDPTNKDSFPKSHVLQILLFVVGIASIAGSIFIFLKEGIPDLGINLSKKTSPLSAMQGNPGSGIPAQGKLPQGKFSPGKQPSSKGGGFSFGDIKMPMIDFGKAKKDMKSEEQTLSSQKLETHSLTDDALDVQIKKKREEMRMKKMSTVFDEFGEEQPKHIEEVSPVVERVSKERSPEEFQKEKIFNRLENISNDDAFEELEKIKKRKKDE